MKMMLRRYHKAKEVEKNEQENVVLAVDENESAVDENESIDYSKLKVDELKVLLNEKEIPFDEKDVKADLIALLGEA